MTIRPKTLKQQLRSNNPSGDDLACILELQSFLSAMPELQIILKVFTDSFICGSCDFHSVTSSLEEELDKQCEKCEIEMHHTGPMILLTSEDQVRSAEQMTKDDGAFPYSWTIKTQESSTIIASIATCTTFMFKVLLIFSLYIACLRISTLFA